MDSLPNFLTHDAPLRAREARARAPLLHSMSQERSATQKESFYFTIVKKMLITGKNTMI